MIFNFSDYKLRAGDLSSEFKDEILEALKTKIKDDADTMETIKELATESFEEDKEFTKRTLQDYIDDLVEEKAEDAVDRVRIYCEFDLEVKL